MLDLFLDEGGNAVGLPGGAIVWATLAAPGFPRFNLFLRRGMEGAGLCQADPGVPQLSILGLPSNRHEPRKDFLPVWPTRSKSARGVPNDIPCTSMDLRPAHNEI
jgi:hypothetical protein